MTNQTPNGDQNENIKKWAFYGIIGLLGFSLYTQFNSAAQMQARGPEMSYSEFSDAIRQGQVASVSIEQGNPVVSGSLSDGTTFRTNVPNDPTLIPELKESGARIEVKPQEPPNPLLGMLVNFAPLLLLAGVWIFMMRRMQGGAGGAMGLGKSKAKLLTSHEGRVTFDDVAGIEEAKQDLGEIVDFLRDPGKYKRLGAKIPKGALLVGPPGTGKTLISRAVAGEANVPFFTISGSDFVEMFVGVGASRVRDMFEEGRKHAPCIIFIDEIDAVGRHRGAGMGGGNDEREQTLNQLLVEMDGIGGSEGVILIAATNRPDVLDPALLRPGRFDRQIVVPNPDLTGREKILKVHMRKVPVAPDVNAMVIARGTPGFSGADLANLVNEAALLTARRKKSQVGMAEFEDAKDKIMMGAERRTLMMSEDEKKLTAYHEAGHAVVSYFEEGCDPIHKATIIPRGRALGMVMSLPERDRVSMNYIQFRSMLSMAYGGRVAEELTFGKERITSGASGDIQQATKIARAMITQYGYSDELGRVQYEGNEQEVFLGHSVAQKKNISELTAQKIDAEVKRFTDEAEAKARQILTENHDAFVRVAEALLKYETLTGDEVGRVIRGEDIGRQPEDPPPQEEKQPKGSVPGTARPPVPPGPGPGMS